MVRKLWFTAICVGIAYVLVLAGAIRISAQTSQSFQYVIPHFSSSAGSQLILSNLSGANINPEVALRDSGTGQVADTFITIGAGTQQRLTSASFALNSFDGSVVVTSRVRLSVMATVASGSAFETVRAFETVIDSGNPGIIGMTDAIVPFSQGTTGRMRLTLFNPNASQTSVVITPVRSDGVLMGSIQVNIPALGTMKQDLTSLFPQPISGPRDMSHVLIHVASAIFSSGRGIFAEGEMLNFSDANEGIPAPRSDFSAVNAVAVSDAVGTGTIPFFNEGADYATELQLINTSSAAAATVTLTAYGLDGNVVPGTTAASISVPPNGSVRRNVQNIFNFGGQATSGHIAFQSTTGIIAAEAIAGISRTSFVVTGAGPQPDTTFIFSVRDYNPQFFTGFSFLNPGQSAAHLTLRYLSDDGTPNSLLTLTLDPFDPSNPTAQSVSLLANLIPEAHSAGFVHVSSDIPIIATALEGAIDNSVLAALPAMSSAQSYTPPDPTTSPISGTVRSNGAPLAGATIQLTGPATASATTDQFGAYNFSLQQPPAGDYVLGASATGYTLSAPISVHIDGPGSSSRNNDFAATLQTPTITAVQPAGLVAGSASTTLLVVGSPLAPNGQIVFDGTPLPTTLTAASASGLPVSVAGGTAQIVPALRATVDASLIANAHQASIVVQTKDAGGSVRSQPYMLGIGTAAPVLTSLGGIPAPLVAGCCPTANGNSGLPTTIVGTGFLKDALGNGVTVVVSDAIGNVLAQVTPTSQTATTVQATIPPRFLAVGGPLKISVMNPAPTAGLSNALSLTVFNPAAVVVSITPSNANVELEPNSPPLKLTANGFGFKPGATLNVGGVTVPTDTTQPSTANTITGLVPASSLQVGGVIPVTVVNPEPAIGPPVSVPLNLQNLPPVLDSVQPTSGPLSFDPTRPAETYTATVVVDGANFSSASLFELVNQCAPIAISPTTATVPVFQKQQFSAYLDGQPAGAGSVIWSVTSSVAGSQGSVGQIDINGLYTAPAVVPNPAVVIVTVTSVADPTKFAVATVTIVSTASGGVASSVGALGATLVNSHEAVLNVTISCAGQYLIDVRNPQPGGGISQKISFSVGTYTQPATPVISSFSPPTAPGINVPFTLTITGTGFETFPTAAYVSFGNTILFPKSVTATSIQVDIPGYLITEHGNIPVVVINPDGGSSVRAAFPVF